MGITRKVIADLSQIKHITGEKKWKCALKCALKGYYILPIPFVSKEQSYILQLKYMLKRMKYRVEYGYVYPYCPFYFRAIPMNDAQIASVTVDFSCVLESDLYHLYHGVYPKLVKIIDRYVSRCKDLRFPYMLYHKPQSFDEALQKILFFDGLFWQARHQHVGLGRLDLILWDYYENDLNAGVLTKEKAHEMLRNFCSVLGKDYKYKSNCLLGDTGQYILLGGIDKEGNTVQNDITTIFLDIFAKNPMPDPKLILRVNSNTSDMVWSAAVSCLANGCGSPLIMNERPIIDGLTKFGYDKEDVWNLGTSACWEPLIIGKSFDQNNPLPNIVALKPLNDILGTNIYNDFDSFLEAYKKKLDEYIVNQIHDICFDVSPLFSLFFKDCQVRKKDFSKGGAKYSYHGIQVVGLPNLINSLLALKVIVFEKKMLSQSDCAQILKNNFKDRKDILALIKNIPLKFGSTCPEVVSITNDIMTSIDRTVSSLSINGEKIKVGFSSPSYISESINFPASFDGRLFGDPFGVHISPISSGIDLSEVLSFASKLEYCGTRLNGNVLDFIIPQCYLNHPNEFIALLKDACIKGVYELQFNVLKYDMLIDAKNNPEKYPSLIVRVWGFSAYFNDLPEEYKDNLICRAKIYANA